MGKTGKLLIMAAVLAIFAGCTTVNFSGIQAVRDIPSFTVLGEFKETFYDPRFFFGVFPLRQPDEEIFETIRQEIANLDGDAAINVSLKYYWNIWDILLAPINIIYAPRHIVVSGVVIKYR